MMIPVATERIRLCRYKQPKLVGSERFLITMILTGRWWIYGWMHRRTHALHGLLMK